MAQVLRRTDSHSRGAHELGADAKGPQEAGEGAGDMFVNLCYNHGSEDMCLPCTGWVLYPNSISSVLKCFCFHYGRLSLTGLKLHLCHILFLTHSGQAHVFFTLLKLNPHAPPLCHTFPPYTIHQGPTAREVNRDSTSFDRTRAEWSKSTIISARGKVGGGGDAKSNNWLG